MRLKKRSHRSTSRRIFSPIALLALSAVAAALVQGGLCSPHASAQPPDPRVTATAQPASTTASPSDPLGDMVVTPGASRPLPKLGVVPSLSSDSSDVVLTSVIQRDLDLSGEFELLPRADAPASADASSAAVDTAAWKKKGAEAVVRVTAKTEGDKVSLAAQAYLVKDGDTPVFDWKATTDAVGLRDEAHRLADLLIGALTGQNGGFYSRMAFTSGQGSVRLAYVMDADGHDAHAVSSTQQIAIGAAFGKGSDVYWISSEDDDPYEIRTSRGPVSLPVAGSVYGLAFSKDASQIAVSIGTPDGIRVFTGSDFASLTQASAIQTAIEPTFSPSGKVAFSGAGSYGQRIYVGGKAISPDGVFATSPTFCNHPDGVIAIFAAGSGKTTDLARTGEQGGPLVRLTAGQGSNSSPACSPDGRLVAFFSTRTTGEGPGLYVMRVDGRRPKRVSTLLGGGLEWARKPAPAATPAAPVPPDAAHAAVPASSPAVPTPAAPASGRQGDPPGH